MDFWNGLLSALPVLIAALFGQYLLLRKSNREDRTVDAGLTERQRVARVKERRADDRIALDEYRELFDAVKADLEQCRKDHRLSERRNARLEATLIAAGIPLLPFPPDEGTGEHPAAE